MSAVSWVRVIGLWLGTDDPGLPDVHRYIDPTADPAERAPIANRLDAGIRGGRALSYMGPSTCRICGCLNGSGELTDGVFIWPEGLSHYVRDHGVTLPDEVEQQLRDDPALNVEEVRALTTATKPVRDETWWTEITAVN
jgi:hypothetical protein